MRVPWVCLCSRARWLVFCQEWTVRVPLRCPVSGARADSAREEIWDKKGARLLEKQRVRDKVTVCLCYKGKKRRGRKIKILFEKKREAWGNFNSSNWTFDWNKVVSHCPPFWRKRGDRWKDLCSSSRREGRIVQGFSFWSHLRKDKHATAGGQSRPLLSQSPHVSDCSKVLEIERHGDRETENYHMPRLLFIKTPLASFQWRSYPRSSGFLKP